MSSPPPPPPPSHVVFEPIIVLFESIDPVTGATTRIVEDNDIDSYQDRSAIKTVTTRGGSVTFEAHLRLVYADANYWSSQGSRPYDITLSVVVPAINPQSSVVIESYTTPKRYVALLEQWQTSSLA